ncbi:peptidase family M48-domain-containing protein [Cytidiella melzeri]|nr:peptidase family M48-domain-containing protein [Cytidiella melzeri]
MCCCRVCRATSSLYITAMFSAHRALCATLRSSSTSKINHNISLRFLQAKPFSSASVVSKQVRYRRFDDSGPNNTSKRWTLGARGIAGIAVAGGVYYVTHLERVPETGRWRFMNVSPKVDSYMAETARLAMLQEFEGKILPPSHRLTRHISDVVTRILEANDLGKLRTPHPADVLGQATHAGSGSNVTHRRREEVLNPEAGGIEWELLVVDDESVVNAAAAYGNIIVYTGILSVAQDEQGLAAVLGHEIGHVVARHNAESFSFIGLLQVAVYLASEFLDINYGLLSSLATYLLQLPHSRAVEFEADEIGLRLMSKACYDPGAAPKLQERLGKYAEKEGVISNLSFMYTHPPSEARVKQKLPQAYAIRAGNAECAFLLDNLQQFNTFASGGGRWGW